MKLRSLSISTSGDEAYNMGYEVGTFIGENIYLLIALIIGIIFATIMRKNFKAKP